MNTQIFLLHAAIRHPIVDSPETARRREQLLWLRAEGLEARKRRRRELARRAWNPLGLPRRDRAADRLQRVDAPTVQDALR